ncbi:hypothetical protein [Paludisphaera rhizosphaerae]|uniref:hypothetical protein n=1 Tax=Paludisphaera rhizosphaerae TaxID=2711216 RepID=UPI0013EE1E1C|nr:hypothetical protein [Paludisphaera rhizosphaerae]
MSWHTSAVLIGVDRSGDVPAFLEELGFPGAVYLRSVDFEEATGLGDFGSALTVAVATVDGWTALWGPILVADQEALLRASELGPALTLIMEGASDTYGFELFRDGAKVRGRLEQAGQIIYDEGEPLSEELEVVDDPADWETRLFDLMGRVAVPIERLSEVEYDLYELP